MGLTIKPNFNVNDIKNIVQQKLDKIEQAIIFRLQYIGENFVSNARQHANFTDRTGNLRSSIGYVILKNGETIFDNFESVHRGSTDGKGGVEMAMNAIKKAAGFFPKGFVLIVVAGMEYAAAVESKNYDVITSSSLIAEEQLKKAITNLNKKIPLMQ